MTTRGSSVIGKIVTMAKILGELGHRKLLIQEELKGLNASDRKDRAFPRSAPARIAKSRRADYALGLEEHGKHVARMRFLAQQELEQLERLSFEIESEMNESVSSLRKRLA